MSGTGDLRYDEKDPALQSVMTEGEDIVYSCHIHDAIYWKAVALFIAAMILGIFVAQPLGILFLVVATLAGIHAVLMKYVLRLAVSDKRVLTRYGLLQVEVVDLPFDKVESVEIERMLPGQIFGYGNVVIMGTGNRYIRIPYVANPRAFRRAYNELVLED